VEPAIARKAAKVEYEIDTGPFARHGKMAVQIEP
jgi:hypothetical protein